MSGSLLFVGDASWDISLEVDHVPAPDEKVLTSAVAETAGGVVANAAVAATCAGASARALLGLGQDSRGRAVAAELEQAGVEVVAAARGSSTSLAVIVVDRDGEKRLILALGDPPYPPTAPVEALSLEGVSWVHTAVYDAASAAVLVERCRQHRIPWSLDLEPATFPGGIGTLERHLQGAAVVFCNDAAAVALGPDPVAVLVGHGAGTVVRTRGRHGAELHVPGQPMVPLPPPPAPVVDTTGAGDCLAGWYIAGLAAGVPPVTALRRAVTAASLSCGRPGGHRSYPTTTAVVAALGEIPGGPAWSATKEHC